MQNIPGAQTHSKRLLEAESSWPGGLVTWPQKAEGTVSS